MAIKLLSILATIFLILFLTTVGPNLQAVVPPPDGAYPGANTAEGQNALFSLTSGVFNTAVGFSSLRSNAIGAFNTAVGGGALFANTGARNTATGAAALLFHGTGNNNTANGALALLNDLTGDGNTATGAGALFNNNDGSFNVANGLNTLASNVAGDENTAIGTNALSGNSTGHDNTAVGKAALLGNTTGSGNIAVGADAGSFLTTGNNNIDIGNTGVNGESETIRVGDSQTKTFIAGIRGVTISNTVPVLIDPNGQLGTMSSSRRFKQEIKPMDKASEAILALKPVTFQYKSDNTAAPQFGLIAEDVAAVNPNLVVRDKEGAIYTVRYDAVNAMLLNEFLKEHRKNEQQEASIAELKKEIAALTASVQKVSAQCEMSESRPQTVSNNR